MQWGCVVRQFLQCVGGGHIRREYGGNWERKGKYQLKKKPSDKLAGELVGMDSFDTRVALACTRHKKLSWHHSHVWTCSFLRVLLDHKKKGFSSCTHILILALGFFFLLQRFLRAFGANGHSILHTY